MLNTPTQLSWMGQHDKLNEVTIVQATSRQDQNAKDDGNSVVFALIQCLLENEKKDNGVS